MTFWAILLLLVLVAAVVAYVGDQVAKNVGKRHWRFFGLRPRATATLVAVGTGVLIALGGFGTFFLLVRDARETILRADQVRQERDRLRTEVDRLESRAAATLTETNQLKSERAEFERNNQQLARQLDLYAQQQQQTREELNKTLADQQKLTLEADQLRNANESQRKELQRLQQSRQTLLAERQRLQQQRTALADSQSQAKLQTQKAEKRLRDLQQASKEALTRYNDLQTQAKALQTRTAELQARLTNLTKDKDKLESDKRNLEGDVAVLVARNPSPKEGGDPLTAALANVDALQKDNATLRDSLASTQRELQQLRDRSKLIMAGLNKALGAYLLAEQGLQSPAEAQNSLAELLRKADGRSRLLGLRGLEVVDSPNLSNLGGGVLLARAIEVNADGRIRVKVEFKAKEKLFSAGEVLVSTGVSLPLAAAEIRRKLEYLNQATAERLTQAGWIPEKISPEGVPPDALMALMGQLSGKRGGVRIGVVALDNLYPTETPKLGLQIVP